MIKTFKTIDEQIEILKSKGLKIDDVDYAILEVNGKLSVFKKDVKR